MIKDRTDREGRSIPFVHGCPSRPRRRKFLIKRQSAKHDPARWFVKCISSIKIPTAYIDRPYRGDLITVAHAVGACGKMLKCWITGRKPLAVYGSLPGSIRCRLPVSGVDCEGIGGDSKIPGTWHKQTACACVCVRIFPLRRIILTFLASFI